MNRWNARGAARLTALGIAGIVAGAALAAAGRTVTYNGRVVSSDVAIVGGRAYVPLADMARILGGSVVARGSNYEIVSSGTSAAASNSQRPLPGGANQVEGLHGKIGDVLFNGFWRFQVNKVERAASYSNKYADSTYAVTPRSSGDELVIVSCQIKNGHKETEEPILTPAGLSSQATALADDQGQSYAPIAFDARGGYLTAGAAKNFAVIFSVPKGTKVKDLIFTLYGYGMTSTKPSNVRVALDQ